MEIILLILIFGFIFGVGYLIFSEIDKGIKHKKKVKKDLFDIAILVNEYIENSGGW